MNKFIQRFKNLPWMALWQSVTLTYLIVAIAEVLMIWGITQSLALRKMIKILYAPPLDLLILFGVGVGVGALVIYLIEILPSQVFLNTTCLWVLFPCLLITLLIYKSIFPPVLLLSTSQITIMGILMGLFWKGRTYWR
ncbi:peptide chain release factor 1 [Planktothrix mougeotii]|uniref:Peptide chain release factor 1 n=1 Tax=Planktothrix mougeotii LEGE 06226 TaxID=1828728 RepID=A0ABR9U6V4_9CYAN|nr:peptide chain release factor 1 [Planktothrix mougeotii]MBE9142175.1 peptide chain release factor 1 [Planktothrix mougeotii LEGE 06226]